MKNCVLYKTVNIVGKRWTIHILLELYKGEKKEKGFNELKRRLGGVTPRILSARLIELEYYLTESGEEFIKVIQEIKKWGSKWKFSNNECDRPVSKYCDL